MKAVLTFISALMLCLSAEAQKFSYNFKNTPISQAIVSISKDNPDVNISFIYKELDNYTTSARVRTDDTYEALRQTVGLNPISVVEQNGEFYVEAMQKGKYIFRGRAVGEDSEPVSSATVMLLSSNDSTVITYGLTDRNGRFAIPCDCSSVLAKLCCIGYLTTYRQCPDFNCGTIVMPLNAIMLSQVKVEAQMAAAYTDRTVYIPSSHQKNAAQNAIDLLRQMAIPQIQVSPIDDKVTDNVGGEVSLFVNYMPATAEELDGMNITDVRRVEYLECPVDPRFRGAMRAINIIVQEYVYGGYTKITADENFLIGLSSRTNVFSKFTYKKLTYDIYVASNNFNNHHEGYDISADYSLKDDNGNDFTLTRTETITDSHYRQNQVPLTFRATYNTEKVQIRNTLGYSHTSYPIHTQSGALTYSDGNAENYTFDRSNPSRSNSFSYNGTFYFVLPNNFTINATPQFSYTHNNNLLTYCTSLANPIVRNARENAYNYRFNAYSSKKLGQSHTLSLSLLGGGNINRLNYTGNAEYNDRFQMLFAGGQFCYRYQTQKINLYADAGMMGEESDINGLRITDRYPFFHASMRYTPNTKNAISSYFQYANNTPGIDWKASDLLQENEYMYVTGNPELDNCRHLSFNLSYAYMPSNKLTLNAYGSLFEMFDRQMVNYVPYNDGKALLRTYINDGNYLQSFVGTAANVKLFGSKLQLYISPKMRFCKSTGIYDNTCNFFELQTQATYYLNKFYFQTFYITKQKSMFSNSPVVHCSRDYYGIEAGWGNSKLNVSLTAYNLFKSGWDSAERDVNTPLYTEHRTNIGTSSHSRINLSVTYTFGYGKKVQHGNEIGEQQGASSAIIK